MEQITIGSCRNLVCLCLDRPARCIRFQPADTATIPAWAINGNQRMANLASESVLAVNQNAFGNHSTANACTERQVDKVLHANGPPEAHLAQSGTVAIVG